MARHYSIPPLHRILAIGRDISLLSSGANILTQAGYTADLVHDVDHAMRRVCVGHYDLALVSTSFNYDEQIAIRARLKQVRQNLPVLVLADEHDSPDTFLAAVADCLKQKNDFHFGTRIDDSSLWDSPE